MAIRDDASGEERQHLLAMMGSAPGAVLEIGCGSGRLTAKYVALSARLVGVDLPAALPAGGNPAFPPQSYIAAASAVALPLPRAVFDLAIFAHSL